MIRAHQTLANQYTYRQEQMVWDNTGIHWTLHTGKTFTSTATFSRKQALKWIAQGRCVWEVNNANGKVRHIYN